MNTRGRIGIDLGGTKTRLVLVGAEGNVLTSATRRTAEYGAGVAAATALAVDIRNLAGAQGPDSIGVGASGPVLPDGTIANPDTLPGFSGFNLADSLQAALHVPCRVDNDALAAALGEWTFGAGQGARRLLMVTLGTGIGVAVINDGAPYTGTDGITPESGHIQVAGVGNPCYCGLTNCWEQVALRTSLQRLALAAVPSEIAAEGPQVAVAQLALNPEQSDVFTTFAERVAAVSSDHCESAGARLEPSSHESGWGAVVEAGAGPFVQLGGRCPDLVVAVLVEGGSFGCLCVCQAGCE